MAQAALPFETAASRPPHGAPLAAAPAPDPADAVAQQIGRDFARYKLTPPVAHLHADNPVRQGWQAARAVFGARTLEATPAVRQWLALRLEAWQYGLAFEEVQVTPQWLVSIAVHECPVTLEPLTGENARIVRLRDNAAYAAGNLVMLSERAARAKAGRDPAAALRCAERIEAGECAAIDGLDALSWRRLALLLSWVSPLAPAQAAALPLLMLPPNRLRLLNPVQALQLVLTLQFGRDGYARRIVALAALMPGDEARHAFQTLLHTMLARWLAAGRPHAGPMLIGLWSDALVQRRWQRLALLLTAAQCERLLERAQSRQLVAAPAHWLAADQATEGWALATQGRAEADTNAGTNAGTDAGADAGAAAQAARRDSSAAALPSPAAAPGLPATLPRPGSARSLGSQKLAS